MNIAIFLFVLCNFTNATKYQIYKKTNGFDYRPNIQESPIRVYRIIKYFENKRLLDTLKNPQISIHIKRRLLSKTEFTSSNIFAGGLMKDFLFDIEDGCQ